jgi:hypothetical protein
MLLYDWANQWVLDAETVKSKRNTVIVFLENMILKRKTMVAITN